MILSELELCPTCKKGKLRTTEEVLESWYAIIAVKNVLKCLNEYV